MTDCAAPRHDGQDEPSPVEAHSALCKPCRLGLLSDLRRLPRLHAELDAVPGRGDGDGSGLPFSEPASECRDQIRHDLTHWTIHVTTILGDDAPPPPAVRGDSWSSRPVYAMAGWLAGQVSRSAMHPGWICYRDWAPLMAGAMGENAARARTLLDPFVRKQFPLPDACPECGNGVLEVTIYATDGDRRKSFIGCLGCGAQWDFGGDWLPFLALLKRLRKVSPDMEVVA